LKTNFLNEHRCKNSMTDQKDHTTWSSWFHLKGARLVQYTQISKCNAVHKQNKGEKLQDFIIYARKTFDKIQHPFMIKSLKKQGIEEIYLNIIKFIYNKWGETNHFL
jgi:hypothetical protein